MTAVDPYDPFLFSKALELDDDLDDDGVIETERASPVQDPASIAQPSVCEVWARCLRKIPDDPSGRPDSYGTFAMAKWLVTATATMSLRGTARHRRAGGHPVRPDQATDLLTVDPDGLARRRQSILLPAVTSAIAAACRPMISGTSDRGQLDRLDLAWRGAGRDTSVKGLFLESATKAPLYLLDKLPALVVGENTLYVFLAALEPQSDSGRYVFVHRASTRRDRASTPIRRFDRPAQTVAANSSNRYRGAADSSGDGLYDARCAEEIWLAEVVYTTQCGPGGYGPSFCKVTWITHHAG